MKRQAALIDRSGQLHRSTTKESVAVWLRREIVEERIAPGERLSLKQVTDQLQVSLTPVREAFEALAAEGLLRIDPFKGARVTELTAEEYEEIFLMRVGLEGLAHRLGAEQISEVDCRELEKWLERMAKASGKDDVGAFLEADRAFHEIIFAASGRRSLRDRIMSLRIANERYTRAVYRMPKGGMRDTITSHRQILEACHKRQGKRAEKLMMDDLRVTYESFREIRAAEAVSQLPRGEERR